MKKALFALWVMAIAPPPTQASIIVSGNGPFGLLTNAHLEAPQHIHITAEPRVSHLEPHNPHACIKLEPAPARPSLERGPGRL